MIIPDFLPLQLLAAGAYPLSKDQQIYFDERDLHRMSAAFNGDQKPPRLAPVVIGHPENDAPSFGEVYFLKVQDGNLIGYAQNLSDSFRRSMREGGYPRYAAQFFAPENPRNPVPGSWFLKHVGFRGKVPPSVRGYLTTDAEFMEQLSGPGKKISPEMRLSGPGYVEFSQFASTPSNPTNIALLALAVQSECAARGRYLNISEAVAAVRSMTDLNQGG